MGGCFNPTRSRGGSVASSAGNIESNCDSSFEYFANQSYHYGNTIIDNDETLRNNISVNERGHSQRNDDDDDDDDNDVDGEDDASNSPTDKDDEDDDEDGNEDDDNPNGDNDGDSGGKSVISSNHGYGNHVAGRRSRAHSFTNNISPNSDLLSSSRSFSRGTAKLSGGTINPGFLSSYGPHRVIVSKAHKQHGSGGGELVLEYEC